MRTGRNAILAEYLDMVAYEQGQKESKKRQEENWRQSTDKDAPAQTKIYSSNTTTSHGW
jgi:hypothetical protein